MPNDPIFYQSISAISGVLLEQKPAKILIGSSDAERYSIYFHSLLHREVPSLRTDQVDLSQAGATASGFFQNVYPLEHVLNGQISETYDMVFLTDLLEPFSVEAACGVLDKLLGLASQSVLIAMPLLSAKRSENGEMAGAFRKFHPVVFYHYDFSLFEPQTPSGRCQIYHFFKQERSIHVEYPQTARSEIASAEERKLKIAYLLPHKNLTGGMKCLLEQMRQLHRRGHSVYAVYRNGEAEQGNRTAIPAWSDLNPETDLSGEIVLASSDSYLPCLGDFDVVMVGFMSQLPEFLHYSGRAAVVYWEQGYEALYGDYGRLAAANDSTRLTMQALYHANVHFLAVSDLVAKILKSKFGAEAHVLYNGIDTEFYHPDTTKQPGNTILLVGNPALPFKGFAFALRTLEKVWAMGGRFKVQWACQVKPQVQNLSFPIEFHVLPAQDTLAELYRQADLFFSTSLYESFPMPPFEAMASGLPVVSTDCGGIHTYAADGENALLVDQEDVDMAAGAVIRLLQDGTLRERLSKAGRQTAEKYTFARVAADAERYFYQFASPAAAHPKAPADAEMQRQNAETECRKAPTIQRLNRAELSPDRLTFEPQAMTPHELGLLMARIGNGLEGDNYPILEQALSAGRLSAEDVERQVERYALHRETAYNAAGTAYYALGDQKSALRFFTDGYAANKTYRDVVFNLAYCLIELGLKEDALQVIGDSKCTDQELLELEAAARSL